MEYYTEQDGYFVIPADSIATDTTRDFDIYIRVDGKYLFYRSKDIPFGEKEKEKLKEGSIDAVYVDIEDKDKYTDYIEKNLPEILRDPRTSIEKKGGILYFYSTNLVKEVLKEPRAGKNIEKTQDLVKNTVDFLIKGENTFKTLVTLIKSDYYTYTHSVNVCLFSIALAEKIGMRDKEELNKIGLGAILHDVGKTKIDKNIINKWGPLVDWEWDIMKKHPEFGVEVCKETNMVPEECYHAIMQHHEKCNGTGYPKGLKGDEIHMFGKIVSIADVFDALTTNRSYAFAVKPFPALKIMKDKMPGSFDIDLLKEFIILLGTQS